MQILYENNIEDATIDSSSENPDYDFDTALNDTRLSRTGRTTGVSSQWVKFSFTGTIDVTYICILGANITSGATVTIEANSSDSWGSPAFSQALTYYDGVYITNFTQETYQYWRLTIDDGSNTDGYIEIGFIFLGESLAMPPMLRNQKLPRTTTSTNQKSMRGQLYGNREIILRSASINFAQAITNSYKTNIDTFFETVETIQPFIMLVWENSLDIENPMYCNLTKSLEWSRAKNEDVTWNLTMDVQECK